jgi:energy-coupling factor transporter ATP-binding protein EcfA2
VVFPRLVASEHGEMFEQGCIKSGITALDALLGGGPERGTSTLLLGPAGSGKSTIAAQYAIAAAERGEHAALFLFDESAAVLEARSEALGMKFKKVSRMASMKLQQVDAAELTPGEFCLFGATFDIRSKKTRHASSPPVTRVSFSITGSSLIKGISTCSSWNGSSI